MMADIIFVVGTRPEIIKIAPLIFEAEKLKINYTLIHTGQHYDYNMSEQFFTSLGIRNPDLNLNIKENEAYDVLGEMIKKLGAAISEIKPLIVFGLGDTISVLATCLACVQEEIPFGHLEAGLRSYDLTMPEERNRRIIDSISSLYFAPSERAVTNLYYEGIDPERIFFTGNTIVDAIRIFKERMSIENTEQAEEILSQISNNFIVCTFHRVSNVENKNNLKEIISFLANYSEIPIIFLIHPRTKKKIIELGKYNSLEKNSNLHIHESINYFSILKLLSNERCLMILTDSGGLQEEAAILQKPCITLRPNTERPETVLHQINTLIPTEEKSILKEIQRILSEDFENRFDQFGKPYGNGYASKEILEILEKHKQKLLFDIPINLKQGSKSYHLLELGSSMKKTEIEDQFLSKITAVYDDYGNPEVVQEKMKKGNRVRILKD